MTSLEATVAAYIDAVFENRFFISVLLTDFASSEKTREKRRAFLRECLEAIVERVQPGTCATSTRRC